MEQQACPPCAAEWHFGVAVSPQDVDGGTPLSRVRDGRRPSLDIESADTCAREGFPPVAVTDPNDGPSHGEAVECEYYVWDPATQQYSRTDPHTGEALLRDPHYMQYHFHLVDAAEEGVPIADERHPLEQHPYDLPTQNPCAGRSETDVDSFVAAAANAARETFTDAIRAAESAARQASEAQSVASACKAGPLPATLRDTPETQVLASPLYVPSQAMPGKQCLPCQTHSGWTAHGDPASLTAGELHGRSLSLKSSGDHRSHHQPGRMPQCEELENDTRPPSAPSFPERIGACPHHGGFASEETDGRGCASICGQCMCQQRANDFVFPQDYQSGSVQSNHWQHAHSSDGTKAGRVLESTEYMKGNYRHGFQCGAKGFYPSSASMRISLENGNRQSSTGRNRQHAETTHTNENDAEGQWGLVQGMLDVQSDREEEWYEPEEQFLEHIVGSTVSDYEETPDAIGKTRPCAGTGLSTSRPWGVAPSRAASSLKNQRRGPAQFERKLENTRARLRVAEQVAAVASPWRRRAVRAPSPNSEPAASRLACEKPNPLSRDCTKRTGEHSRDTDLWHRSNAIRFRNSEGVCGGTRRLPPKSTSQGEGAPGRRLRQHDPVSRGCQLRAAWEGDPFLRQQKRTQFDMKAYDTWLRNKGHLLRAKALELQREEQRLLLLMMQQQYPGTRKASGV
ncbi:conserved hypothetical protein [Neospora caninum Liverpool]|uniref:Uncharacterized protein n=1 Tax=Neospora caninum (strain Liverpool) TaxID=572307 RepID=F0V935_NEOCL|nr:conserved hypothetical protein [Neospora caninum Liverpool]CBZ50260.1 conserved hypothetical protein [Neospora caninum Liverpool]CEL64864.1 TPA: hypothetical protein BN1204_007340 [Neospora caninum Liverpool]|eukprot:XP_003880294.1 conserved hypothetical protein [Neospora caninum Liverpool]